MALSDKHPQYNDTIPDITDVRACYKGERHIKEKGAEYLPPTASQVLDGLGGTNPGEKSYQAYKMRAQFPDYVKEAVEAMIGVMHSKDANIELPSGMEELLEKATASGESLQHLLRRINEEQLVAGRLGLLLDLPKNPNPSNPLPYIATYLAETLLNWDDADAEDMIRSLNLVVLDESAYVRENFTWTWKERYRVLQLGTLNENETVASYSQGLFVGTDYVETDMVPPTFRGKTLDAIPFVFINTKDVVADPDTPPLVGLARLCLSIYRSEADYRQNLYMQGQDTLVTVGMRHGSGAGGVGQHVDPDDEDALRTGAGARIDLDIGGDAKYIGVNSQGLSEQRQAIQSDKETASMKAGQLVTSANGNEESGEALKIRRGAQTATLKQIAITGAAGLQQLLRLAARWMGKDESKVVVTPNLDFGDLGLMAQELLQIMQAKALGAPISEESIHDLMVERGLTKKTFDEEQKLLEDEADNEVPPPVNPIANQDPNNPDDPNNPQNQPPQDPTKTNDPAEA